MPSECPSIIRSLYAWEIQEVRLVFENSLKYDRVRLHECASWTDTLDRVGRLIRGFDAPTPPNAVTLGSHCYFPVRLLTDLVGPEDMQHYKIGWLIHELGHVWQYQHHGWAYVLKSLGAQFGQGDLAYDFGGEAGLTAALQAGWMLEDFNTEQQGEICRFYYNRLVRGMDLGAWMPFIQELQAG